MKNSKFAEFVAVRLQIDKKRELKSIAKSLNISLSEYIRQKLKIKENDN
jgi:hypothetical protein